VEVVDTAVVAGGAVGVVVGVTGGWVVQPQSRSIAASSNITPADTRISGLFIESVVIRYRLSFSLYKKGDEIKI
jgi:hypothetical protein